MSSISNPVDSSQGSFTAGLTGNQELPKVNTTALGSAIFIPLSDAKMAYNINITDINNVTRTDLHIGAEGKEGPLIVDLFSPQSNTGHVNGSLTHGNITSDSLIGPMQGKKISALMDLMLKGDVYVNVRTQLNTQGEIRGQVGFAGVDETGTGLGEGSVPKPVHEVD